MTPDLSRYDLAEMWLSTLRLQASTFDPRNNGEHRSEHWLDELFFDLVTLSRPSVFVEVGAHDGMRAVRARNLLPDARVVALEANPDNYRLFSSRTDFSTLGVEYMHAAATEWTGQISFNVESATPEAPTGASSLLQRNPDRNAVSASTAVVPALRLDDLAPPSGSTCLWIDVEGANEQVLSGAQGLLAEVDVMKIEVEEAEFWSGQWLSVDVLAHLLAAGLVPLVRDRAQGDWQYNILLVSKRMVRTPETSSLVADFLQRGHERELPGVLGRLRRNGTARALMRRIAGRA